MHEIHSFEEFLTLAGFKIGSLIAGFAGSIVSLVANKQLTFLQSLLVILCGVLSSGYITPAITDYFTLSRSSENVLAFFLGMLGMFLVIGFVRFGEDFSKNPIGAVKKFVSLRYFILNQPATETEVLPTPDEKIKKEEK